MRRTTAVAAGLWVALGVVTGNVLLDHEVDAAAQQYIYEATLAFRGEAPAVAMDAVMQPAVARGVRLGSEWGGAIAAGGLAAVAWAARRKRI